MPDAKQDEYRMLATKFIADADTMSTLQTLIDQISKASRKMAASNCKQPLAGILCQNPKFLLNRVLQATLVTIQNGGLNQAFERICRELDLRI